ncbi:DUF968 domain-containing protein [Serratia fonticola]|uniref:DUF968 domain-containing protein n=1 Tax=Serratia fonticola TaxID=47917 RepID=UPI0034C698B9
MKALCTPKLQRELGLAIIPVTDALFPIFGGRVLVATEPREFEGLPDGLLPAGEQPIANEPQWQPFFQNERVIRAAGGINSLEAWTTKIAVCQRTKKTHSRHHVTVRYHNSALRLCEGCDNETSGHTTPKLDALANANLARWVVDVAAWRMRRSGELSAAELALWAAVSGVDDLLPEAATAQIMMLPAPVELTGTMRESDITQTPAATEIFTSTTKAVKAFTVDPEPPKSFMLIPKLTRAEDSKWTRWVKTQPCTGCGEHSDDPHHVTGHGLSGAGMKPHDYFTLPMCRICHDALHLDVAAWEAEHGRQNDLLVSFWNYSIAMGALS